MTTTSAEAKARGTEAYTGKRFDVAAREFGTLHATLILDRQSPPNPPSPPCRTIQIVVHMQVF